MMSRVNKAFIFVLRSIALISVFSLGLLSLLATSSNNDPGVVGFSNAGYDNEVEARVWIPLDGTGSYTPLDANPGDRLITYFWEVVEEPEQPVNFPFPATYEWENATQINPRFKPLLEGEYVIRLTVRWAGLSDFDTVSVFAHDGLVPPVANAGPDRFVKHGHLLTLDATGSQDWDWNTLLLNTLDYSWSIVDQPQGSDIFITDRFEVNPILIPEAGAVDSRLFPSRYQLSLHAVDGNGKASKPDLVDIFVYPPEGYVYPVPVAGPDQTVTTGSVVTLDASDSYDVDGRSLTYQWQFHALPVGSNAILMDVDTANPFFTADRDGIYVVQLAAGNGQRNSSDPKLTGTYGEDIDRRQQDRTVIHAVTSNSDAVADAGPDRIVAATLTVPLDGSDSYDLDGDVITYRWWLVDTPPSANASINNATDVVANSASLLTDQPGTYVIGLWVINGDTDQVIITITDNTAPNANAGDDQAVTVGSTVQLSGDSSTDTELDTLRYGWSLVNAPGDWQNNWPVLSEGMDANPSFTPTLNGEYRLQLTVNDEQFNSAVDPLLITVSGSSVNTAPIANAGDDQTVNVGSTVLLDGGGSSDADNNMLNYLWAINIRPLSSNAILDNEISPTPSFVADAEGNYEVQLVVNDGLENSIADTMTVNAITASACANPLTLTTSLPFAPNLGEIATNIEIDAVSSDTLGASAAVDALQSWDVYQARIPDGNNLDQAEFVILGSAWEETSRSHANPVSDSESPSFVVRRVADNIFYRIDLDFTGSMNLEAQIDALSGCRCGNSAADCPL